jgi:putative oxidoreductase
MTRPTPLALIERGRAALDAVPYGALALIARGAAFSVFFRSGMLKLSDWSSTLALFQNEYHVPVLPPQIAAFLATGMELGLSSLLLAGLCTRLAGLGLLSMVLVIQLFIYPGAWPDHIQWLAFMAPLVARGPGAVSLDALLGRMAAARGLRLARA